MKRIAHEETGVVVADGFSEALPPWSNGGIGAVLARWDRAKAGLVAIIDFGRAMLHYQDETGLPMTDLLQEVDIPYRTGMRYISAARAADALLSSGMTELPNSATAILSAAKSTDADRAEELKAEIEKNPEDPAAQEVWRKVMSGETPVGRWRAAYAGLNKTFGTHRKDGDATKLADRALASLRTVWGSWDYMPGADKGDVAERIAATLFGDRERGWAEAPAGVIEEIERAVARRQADAGKTNKGGKKR